MESLGSNMAALKLNYRNAYNDIVTQQQARLSQRASSMAPDLGVFLPTNTAVVNNSSSALTTGLIQAGLMGASAGIDAGLKYGSPKGDALTITSANSSGSMMGPPNPYL
jgi:hypothetical protein